MWKGWRVTWSCTYFPHFLWDKKLLWRVRNLLWHSHPVHRAVLGPSPERLPLVVEENTKQAPEQNKRGIGHDGGDEAISDGPIGDELAESVAPHVLVDGDADEQAAGDRLV